MRVGTLTRLVAVTGLMVACGIAALGIGATAAVAEQDAVAEGASAAPAGGGYYAECAQSTIDEVERGRLTQAEYIALRDQALFDALAENAECMNAAFSAGQKAQSAVGAAGANGGADGDEDGEDGQNGEGEGQEGEEGENNADGRQANAAGKADAPEADADGQYMPPPMQPDKRRSRHARGAGNQTVTGKSAEPCELYRELVEQASSAEERAFYRSEMKKYC